MHIKIDYSIINKDYNWKISLLGLIFLSLRIWFMTPLIQDDGSFQPEIFHTSYLVSILICFALIFSFRVKPLNTIALAVLPSVIFTIFLHDIPYWLDPASGMFGENHKIGGLLWWNFITIHTPIPIIAFFTYYTRKETISRESYVIVLWILISWFLFLDNKENGTLDGSSYFYVGGAILIVWTIIFMFWICRDIKSKNILIAPLIKINRIYFSANKK